MQKHQHLSDEVGKIDRLIAAISSEIESERATTSHHDELLREMESAIAELRLERGLRLLLLNAYNGRAATAPHHHSRANRGHHATGWSRAGRRIA